MEPQRIETALALYSSGLSGIVLLEDLGSFDGFTGLSKDFVEVCQQTTEFHFLNIDNQLESIKNQIKQAVSWRHEKSKSNLLNQVIMNNFCDCNWMMGGTLKPILYY